MRERPLAPVRTIEERRALKPEINDIVKFNAKRFIVTAVGNRFIRAKEEGSDGQFLEMIPIQEAIKTGEKAPG